MARREAFRNRSSAGATITPMRSRPRLGDALLAAFALVLVLAVVHRAEAVHAREHRVAHLHAQVHKA
jgi:hypothetical protein